MLIIFDCDGVIIDSMRLVTEVESEAYRSVGINMSPKELALRFSGVGDFEVYRILSQETGRVIPPDIAAQIERRKKAVFAKRLKPVNGIPEALAAIETTPRASPPAPQSICYIIRFELQGFTTCLLLTSIPPRWSRAESRFPISSCTRPTRWDMLLRPAS
jgi:Haloacid dehalogenase-like hydrolase